MNKSNWLMGIVVAGLTATVATAAGTPAQRCQAGKNKAVGTYETCRQNAEAAYVASLDGVARTAALAKCAAKFQAAWPALEQGAADQGSACPSVGDQAAIQAAVDQHTTNVATGLGGGPFQVCTLRLCKSDLATCQSGLSICVGGSPVGQILKTGRATCAAYSQGTWDASDWIYVPCAGTGQDGDLQKGLARSYVDNGDGTITDEGTGLMWEKLSDDGSIHDVNNTYNWTAAIANKIATLNTTNFAGHNDWRLPNVREMSSLLNHGTTGPAASSVFNTGCVPACTVSTCSCIRGATVGQISSYWSSTTDMGSTSDAWLVSFNFGWVGPEAKTHARYVRAVRGG